jgi:hypothetical protein
VKRPLAVFKLGINLDASEVELISSIADHPREGDAMGSKLLSYCIRMVNPLLRD